MSQGKFLKMMAFLLGLCGVAAAIVIPLILTKRNSSVATSATSTAITSSTSTTTSTTDTTSTTATTTTTDTTSTTSTSTTTTRTTTTTDTTSTTSTSTSTTTSTTRTTTTTTSTTRTTTTTTSTTRTTTTTTSTTRTTTTTTSTASTTAATAPMTAGSLLYGVQINLNPSSLGPSWSQCYQGVYSDSLPQSTVNSIVQICDKNILLLACRAVGSSNFLVAAMGYRNDVLYDCGTTSSCTHVANGVGWYFSSSYSWGFVSGSNTVSRSSCDVAQVDPTTGMCWHTGGAGGYQCGSHSSLNSDSTYERFVYHSN